RAELVAHAGEELGLALARLRELPTLLLHLAEQARILDRQHGLRREGLQQIDRTLGKLAGLLAPDHQRADDLVGSEQRYGQQGAETGADDDIEDRRRIGLNVRNLDRHALLCSFADRCVADMDMTIPD